VHKINPDIQLMCKLHGTVKLYTPACSLSDADSYFFPNQGNSFSCSLLNICTSAEEYIAANVRITKEICIRKFKGN
jgi:hypothetical protein